MRWAIDIFLIYQMIMINQHQKGIEKKKGIEGKEGKEERKENGERSERSLSPYSLKYSSSLSGAEKEKRTDQREQKEEKN